ncbi:alpha/beta hydrolase family protein [Kribbella sp. WER1]
MDANRAGVGGDAVRAFLGGTPAEVADRYATASPYERLPLKVPVQLVHGTHDDVVPIEQSRRYRDAASKAGDQVELSELPGVGHFELIDPQSKAWGICRSAVHRLIS